jgi:hypothetical protein
LKGVALVQAVTFLQVASPTHRWFWQVQPAGQGALQSRTLPQPFPTRPPQYWPPLGLQVSGVQGAGMHWLSLQTSPAMQVPQSLLPPQPSPMVPQYLPEPVPHAMGAHEAPPLQRWFWQVQPGVVQALQVMALPQPSPSCPPQYCPPIGLQVAATQPTAGTHWLLVQT